jgi:hypothetical protein
MIESLLVAFVVIAIVALIGWGICRILPVPEPVKTVIWVIVGVICLLIILRVVTGHHLDL